MGRRAGALGAACALVALSFASAGGTGALATGGGGNCPNADDPAVQVSTGDLAKSIVCLVNKERSSHGRSKLDRNRLLAKAAKKHIGAMIDKDCLDHVCGNEPDVETRIRNTGYFSRARSFDYAEDVGCEQTTGQMVKNWMGSPLHRRNILNRKFDDAGVAANHARVPSLCDEGFVTFVIVFGHRAG